MSMLLSCLRTDCSSTSVIEVTFVTALCLVSVHELHSCQHMSYVFVYIYLYIFKTSCICVVYVLCIYIYIHISNFVPSMLLAACGAGRGGCKLRGSSSQRCFKESKVEIELYALWAIV